MKTLSISAENLRKAVTISPVLREALTFALAGNSDASQNLPDLCTEELERCLLRLSPLSNPMKSSEYLALYQHISDRLNEIFEARS